MKIDTNKWNFLLGFSPAFDTFDGTIFHFGIFRITSRPLEGARHTKENYRGFWISKNFRLNGGFSYSWGKEITPHQIRWNK